jgi:predicted type IV restriction endonuclease
MESQKLKQLVKELNKKLSTWDWQKAVNNSGNETTTREFLIHPFLDLLNYDRMDDYTHEVTADLRDKQGKKVDVAITLGGKNPIILIECKKATQKLNDTHYRQLREYCTDITSSKVGILTNGVNYKFYTKLAGNSLNTSPFFEFDLSNYSNQDLETLAMFFRNVIDINSILEEASEIYFLESFDEAFYSIFSKPSDDLIKLIYNAMGGKRINDKVSSKIKDLVNGSSLNTVASRLIKEESSKSNLGIITTEEEIKAYNVIKTIMAMSSKFNNSDLERIGYRDLKGAFLILFDDNQKKRVCSLAFKDTSKVIEIDNERFFIDEVSVASITKLKKQLVDSALKYV